MGIEHLGKIVVVPESRMDPLSVAAVLAEGLDLVICHSDVETNLSSVQVRPLTGWLRAGVAALVMVGWTVPSLALRIDAHITTYRGIGRGSGRITGYDIDIQLENKTNRVRTTTTVGEKPTLRAV